MKQFCFVKKKKKAEARIEFKNLKNMLVFFLEDDILLIVCRIFSMFLLRTENSF